MKEKELPVRERVLLKHAMEAKERLRYLKSFLGDLDDGSERTHAEWWCVIPMIEACIDQALYSLVVFKNDDDHLLEFLCNREAEGESA